jgi:protein involved in polysaccharide export with SLBB domain
MKHDKDGSIWQAAARERWLAALLFCALLAGCKSGGGQVDKNMMAGRGPTDHNVGVAENYLVACPDVLDVILPKRPDCSGLHPIGVDGKIDLASLGRLRVEGDTIGGITQKIADLASVPPTDVSVQVAEYRSQCIYLFGAVTGSQRAVPYQGQETVLDLLKRTGGITPGAAPDEVYVVRTHVGESQRPEVFHVNLPAIVMKHDERTNLRLEPFDQVHVGETRRAGLAKCVPPWFRPFYEKVCSALPLPKNASSPP